MLKNSPKNKANVNSPSLKNTKRTSQNYINKINKKVNQNQNFIKNPKNNSTMEGKNSNTRDQHIPDTLVFNTRPMLQYFPLINVVHF
jgi:hypothetical protein